MGLDTVEIARAVQTACVLMTPKQPLGFRKTPRV
jgi:hypothetical protein